MTLPVHAAAFAAACLLATTHAALAAPEDHAFVDLRGGEANLSSRGQHDSATAWGANVGYRWGYFGVEGGYTRLGGFDLGNRFENGGRVESELSLRGWTLGVNARLPLNDTFYASARGGVFGWRYTDIDHTEPVNTFGDTRVSGRDWYAGLGLGMNWSETTSLGLNVDHYQASDRLAPFDVDQYSLSVEYRFR